MLPFLIAILTSLPDQIPIGSPWLSHLKSLCLCLFPLLLEYYVRYDICKVIILRHIYIYSIIYKEHPDSINEQHFTRIHNFSVTEFECL